MRMKTHALKVFGQCRQYFCHKRGEQGRCQETYMANFTSGVPHGHLLAPILFLCYINDLPNHVSSTVQLFADDCSLYQNINTTLDADILYDNIDRLQTCAKDISSYCDIMIIICTKNKWKAICQTVKCQVAPPGGYVMNKWRPWQICQELLRSIFVCLIS